MCLYPRLLGESWRRLDRAVRCCHYEGEPVHCAGTFEIRHGASRLARILARLFWAAADKNVATDLVITAKSGIERWDRAFGPVRRVSSQREAAGGLLEERHGMLTFFFRLEVERQALVYHGVGAALRVFSIRAPLPRGLAPRIDAREESAPGSGTEMRVEVRVSLPLVGELLSYEGVISPKALQL